MARDSCVYQPTTVSFEQPSRWTSTINNRVNRKCFLYNVLLSIGCLSLILGLIFVIAGVHNANRAVPASAEASAGAGNGTEAGEKSEGEADDNSTAIIVSGAVMCLFGAILLALYIWMLKNKRGSQQRPLIWCCPAGVIVRSSRRKDQISITKQSTLAQNETGSAQYIQVESKNICSDNEEQKQLMGHNNKECCDDTEKVIDGDPRIILQPAKKSLEE